MGRRSSARGRLVASADDLFRDRGFEAVSVAHLCQAAGVNKGSFYHFFSSKRELLLEVIDNTWDETGLLADWETDPPQQPIEQLRRYLQELFAYHYADRETSGKVRGSLLANLALELSTRDSQVADKIAALFKRQIAVFSVLMTNANARGEASVTNTARAADSLVAYLHGLVMLAKVRNDLDVLPDNETTLLRLAGVSETKLLDDRSTA